MDIPCIYCVDIHGISMDMIPCISISMDIHGISMDIPCIFHVYVGHLHIHGIYHLYTKNTGSRWVSQARSSAFRRHPGQPRRSPSHVIAGTAVRDFSHSRLACPPTVGPGGQVQLAAAMDSDSSAKWGVHIFSKNAEYAHVSILYTCSWLHILFCIFCIFVLYFFCIFCILFCIFCT